MKICICSSMSFYSQFSELKQKLEEMGHTVIAPELEFETKGKAITAHFRKIDESDCILVTNYEKKDIPNYIGGNTFLEIGYAYGRGKKIFILNNLPQTSAFQEEILGMQPIILNGDLEMIK